MADVLKPKKNENVCKVCDTYRERLDDPRCWWSSSGMIFKRNYLCKGYVSPNCFLGCPYILEHEMAVQDATES